MLGSLFPMSQYWSWGTFVFYVLLAITVVAFCRSGAQAKKLGMAKIDVDIRYFCAFLILVLLATLRNDRVGPDTKVYLEFFDNATSFRFEWERFFDFKQQEVGFQLYLYFLRKITDSHFAYFLVTYAPVAFAYIKFIRYFYDDKSSYTFLYLFIFFYVADMSGARSALGTVFLLLSFIALDKKKYFRAILLTTIAFTFHYTMLFNYPVIIAHWLFARDDFKQKRYFWVVVSLLSVVASGASAIFLKDFFSETKYDYYSSVSTDERSILGSLFYVIYGVLCFIFYEKLFERKKSLLIITLSMLVAYPFLYVTGAYRVPNYYALPRLAIWSEICNIVIDNEEDFFTKQLIKIGVWIVVIVYLLFRFTRSAVDGEFEYQFIWS